MDKPFTADDFKWEKTASGPPPPPMELHWHGVNLDEHKEEWLVAGLLPVVGKGLISGQWGLYKTFVALDLAGAVMLGTPFAGQPVRRQGGVLFIAAERPKQIPKRLRALVQEVLSKAGPPGDDFLDIDLKQLPIAIAESCPPLLADGTLDWLLEGARDADAHLQEHFELPLALVIIDTVGVASGVKDGNDQAEGQRLMSTLEKFAQTICACVLGVDHFGKNIDSGTIGTSAKESSADVVLALLGEKSAGGAVKDARMAVRKLSSGDSGTEYPFALTVVDLGTDDWDAAITSGAIAWEANATKPKAKSRRAPKSLRIFMDAFREALDEHGRMIRPYADGSLVRAISAERVQTEFFRRWAVGSWSGEAEPERKRRDAKRKRFNAALKLAREEGLVVSHEINREDWLWLAEE